MMTAQRIQVGQVWRKLETGETFLVTKLYNEALATIAVLRPTGAATESLIRIRVDRQGGTQGLPGFSMAQENEGGERRPFQTYIDRTGSSTTSSTCITSFTRNGSAYFTPAIWP